MTRTKHIMQTESGYVTVSGTEDSPHTLVDWVISSHLENNITIGVFSGQHLTKVIGFDVDTKDESAIMTLGLINILTNKFKVSPSSILTSFSGRKGYHVDIFLDKAISIKKAKSLYEIVIDEIGASRDEVELRPTANQGYKLPLSVHRASGRFCHLADNESLSEQSNDIIFDIVQESSEFILDVVSKYAEETDTEKNMLTLDNITASGFEDAIDGLTDFIPTDYEELSERILDEGALIYPDTRHKVSLMLPIYLKEKGTCLEDTVSVVTEIIEKTYQYRRGLIDSETELDYSLREVVRLSRLVFERDYSAVEREPKPIRVYKEDILLTLKPKSKPLRQLLFSMICHSKRYAKGDGTFYMPYSVMSQVGNTKNRARLYEYTCKLDDKKLIEVVRRGKKREKSPLNEVNVYKVNLQKTSKDNPYIELSTVSVNNWANVVTQLIPEDELKPLISKRVFYSTFSKHYNR